MNDGILRQLARRIGAGRAVLKLRHAMDVGPHIPFLSRRHKRQLLPSIASATPIRVGDDLVSVHMLLNHGRIYEGAWTLYSLALHADFPFGVCIHDDGSLSQEDKRLLSHLFPGLRLIDRREGDSQVEAYLNSTGLRKCLEFRRNLVLSLKLFDAVVFAETAQCLVLDSDVLFFDQPAELSSCVGTNQSRFSVDWLFEEAYSSQAMKSVSGVCSGKPVNSGILLFAKDEICFNRVEHYLDNSIFWETNGTPNWFAEQALFGLEMHAMDAKPLSTKYGIVGRSIPSSGLHAIHFCASAPRRELFYATALPMLSRKIAAAEGKRRSRPA